jgi:hypothetical protein
MGRRSRVPEQLDIPLVWEAPPGGAAAPPKTQAPPRQPLRACSSLRLLVAALGDLGLALVLFALVGVVALAFGAVLSPGQLVLLALAGTELASTVAVGCLWGWRATPGMALLGANFVRPLTLQRSWMVWLAWFVLLPVAALPLLAAPRGRRPLERLARAEVSCR